MHCRLYEGRAPSVSDSFPYLCNLNLYNLAFYSAVFNVLLLKKPGSIQYWKYRRIRAEPSGLELNRINSDASDSLFVEG